MSDERELCTVSDEEVEEHTGEEIPDPWDDPSPSLSEKMLMAGEEE